MKTDNYKQNKKNRKIDNEKDDGGLKVIAYNKKLIEKKRRLLEKSKEIIARNKKFLSRQTTIIIFMFSVFCSLSSAIYAQDVKVSVNAKPRVITVGDPVDLDVRIARKKGVSVTIPDVDEYLRGIEILDRDINEKQKKGYEITDLHYKITQFKPGTIAIPRIAVSYTDEEGRELTAVSSPLDIVITSVLGSQQQAYDIKDVKGPFLIMKSIIWLLVVIVILTCAVFLASIMLMKKLRKKRVVTEVDPLSSLTPEERALSRLARLESADLIASGQVKQFYILLSEIVRQYLQERCGFSALDQTTKEILRELRSRKIKTQNMETVKHLFHESDLVKFAKYFPELNMTQEDISDARKIVDVFTPHEEPEEEHSVSDERRKQ